MKINKVQAARAEYERLKKELWENRVINDIELTTAAFKINNFFCHFIIPLGSDNYDLHQIKKKIQEMASGMRNISKDDKYTFEILDQLKIEVLWLMDGLLLESENKLKYNQ